MLLTQVRGLPVRGPDGDAEVGVLLSLTVDAASGTVTHLRVRTGPLGKKVLPWSALRSFGPDAVLVDARRSPDPVPPHHDLLDRTVLTDTGERRGTVLDAAFDESTGRVEAVFTTLGEVPPGRLVGLGDYALVVLAD
ncbi:PRC-barrel domain-containing protein [Streptomyces sp. NPDC051207]|uniref:PRC-barrel domain-containing protein n=1 Tax=Streptomyces sp. NPDC051207 TaxID=3154641 RepID=UPI00343264CE